MIIHLKILEHVGCKKKFKQQNIWYESNNI